jgi:Zn-dependent protease
VLGLSPDLIVARIIAALISMTVHEFAHNYVGYKMGDPVPRKEGRLTLNPLVHINWIGFLMFVLIGFGPLGSAPISPYRMPAQNRRWRWLAAVAAGPVSNLLLAIVVAIIYNLMPGSVLRIGSVAVVLQTLIIFNVLLFVFNLLPLFPLDGWQIVYSLLPPDLAIWWERNQMYTYYAFFGLIFLSFAAGSLGFPDILGIIIGQPVGIIVRFLLGF